MRINILIIEGEFFLMLDQIARCKYVGNENPSETSEIFQLEALRQSIPFTLHFPAFLANGKRL